MAIKGWNRAGGSARVQRERMRLGRVHALRVWLPLTVASILQLATNLTKVLALAEEPKWLQGVMDRARTPPGETRAGQFA